MIKGSIAVPGALVMTNEINYSIQEKIITQLHIDDIFQGEDFDIMVASDPNYVKNTRALRRRVLVIRDHRDTTNRELMDLVLYIKNGMASVSKNCFGPPGQTYRLTDIHWGAFGIFNTDINRTCKSNCGSKCMCSSWVDGYASPANSPYYPAVFDPNFPEENHPYNNKKTGCGCGSGCSPSPEYTLCGKYLCNKDGCVPLLDCRLVRA